MLSVVSDKARWQNFQACSCTVFFRPLDLSFNSGGAVICRGGDYIACRASVPNRPCVSRGLNSVRANSFSRELARFVKSCHCTAARDNASHKRENWNMQIT